MQFLIGAVFGIGIAYLAYRAGSLSASGGIGAAILGTVVFGLGGIGWAVILLTFFFSSSALSKIFHSRKASTEQNFAKGSRRDAGQVVANGGMAGLLALLFFVQNSSTNPSGMIPALWVGFAASLAAANADTWATELGVLNPRLPVMLTSFRRVPKGTSGAVSLLGTMAALAGSALVAGVTFLSGLAGWAPLGSLHQGRQFLLITGAGLLGSMVDSLLGATLQSVYHCPACDKETERHPLHGCGTATMPARGLHWLNNDWVNAACTLSAGILGLLVVVL